MSNCMLVYQSASSQGSQMKPEPITLVTGVTSLWLSRCFNPEINKRKKFVSKSLCKVLTVSCFCNVHVPIFGFS